MTDTTNATAPIEAETVEKPQAVPTPATPKPTAADKKLMERQREIQLDKAEKVATTATSMFDPVAYAQLKQLAADMITGGASTKDADTPEKLLLKLQAGFEMGMQPTEAGNSLFILNGRITIWGAALIARLRKFGWQVSYGEESEESCTIYVRKADEMLDDTFKYQDAVDSGYTQDNYGKEKVGWKKGQNRKLKMRYGAAAQLVKTLLPEVLSGNVGVTEVDQDASWVEAEVIEPADTEYAQKIKAAASREEIMEVVQSAPVSMRTKLVDAAQTRMKELEG